MKVISKSYSCSEQREDTVIRTTIAKKVSFCQRLAVVPALTADENCFPEGRSLDAWLRRRVSIRLCARLRRKMSGRLRCVLG
jgi:hypothetical protein